MTTDGTAALDPLLSLPEAAQRLAVSVTTTRRLIKSGALPAVRVGAQLRVRESALGRVIRDGGTVKVAEVENVKLVEVRAALRAKAANAAELGLLDAAGAAAARCGAMVAGDAVRCPVSASVSFDGRVASVAVEVVGDDVSSTQAEAIHGTSANLNGITPSRLFARLTDEWRVEVESSTMVTLRTRLRHELGGGDQPEGASGAVVEDIAAAASHLAGLVADVPLWRVEASVGGGCALVSLAPAAAAAKVA